MGTNWNPPKLSEECYVLEVYKNPAVLIPRRLGGYFFARLQELRMIAEWLLVPQFFELHVKGFTQVMLFFYALIAGCGGL